MEYIIGIDTAIVSSYLLYYLKVSNKVVSSKISAHKAYHSVNRRRRANLKVGSNSSKINEAEVPALIGRLIDHYEKLKTGGRSKLKEKIQGAKVGTVGSKD